MKMTKQATAVYCMLSKLPNHYDIESIFGDLKKNASATYFQKIVDQAPKNAVYYFSQAPEYAFDDLESSDIFRAYLDDNENILDKRGRTGKKMQDLYTRAAPYDEICLKLTEVYWVLYVDRKIKEGVKLKDVENTIARLLNLDLKDDLELLNSAIATWHYMNIYLGKASDACGQLELFRSAFGGWSDRYFGNAFLLANFDSEDDEGCFGA